MLIKMPTPAKFSETPTTRMIWEATPGPITPAHETPGHDHETPGRGSLSARKRWDETPRTERGIFLKSLFFKKHKFKVLKPFL